MKRTGLIALGMAVALVVIVLAAAQLTPGSSDSGVVVPEGGAADLTVRLDGSDEVLEGMRATDATSAGGAATAGFLAGGPFGGGDAPPLPDLIGRKIVRDATISLEVEDVSASVQRVESIAAGAGGFVSASSVFVEDAPEPVGEDVSPPRRTQSATVTIRVPSGAYTAVMNQLRGLADEVQSESSTTSDVSEEFADLEARQRNLEATEATYLALLGKAETIPDILSLQDRINSVRLEIERIQGRINLLNDLSDLATILVQLRPPAPVVEEPSQPGWAQEVWEGAWDTSKDAMQALGTAAIVIGVVLAWLAVPALVIAVVWRLFGRRPSGEGAGGGP